MFYCCFLGLLYVFPDVPLKLAGVALCHTKCSTLFIRVGLFHSSCLTANHWEVLRHLKCLIAASCVGFALSQLSSHCSQVWFQAI